MAPYRQVLFQLLGGLVGLAIAYAGIALGVYSFGRLGIAILVLSVPAGVLLGSLLIKVLETLHRILSETE